MYATDRNRPIECMWLWNKRKKERKKKERKKKERKRERENKKEKNEKSKKEEIDKERNKERKRERERRRKRNKQTKEGNEDIFMFLYFPGTHFLELMSWPKKIKKESGKIAKERIEKNNNFI